MIGSLVDCKLNTLNMHGCVIDHEETATFVHAH